MTAPNLKSCCPDCGMPVGFETPVEYRINPCPDCGATLRDVETGECVMCKATLNEPAS